MEDQRASDHLKRTKVTFLTRHLGKLSLSHQCGTRCQFRRIKEFGRQHGESVLTDVNGMMSLDMDNVDESFNYGTKIRPMDHPYLLSPPRVPVTGATRTSKDTVKVMAFHGIVYSHQGLSDPAIMP